ncbi:MAG: hypothetical protein AAF514_17140 [Verrucomicrobiota bacterium]
MTLVRDFEASDLTALAFASRHRIKYSTFTNWVRRSKRKTGKAKASIAPALSFAEVVVDQEATTPDSWPKHSSPYLCLRFPGGAWVEIGDHPGQTQKAAHLLKALRSS